MHKMPFVARAFALSIWDLTYLSLFDFDAQRKPRSCQVIVFFVPMPLDKRDRFFSFAYIIFPKLRFQQLGTCDFDLGRWV